MILFVGRIQPLKAPDVLIRAVAELVRRDPARRSRLQLIIIGSPSGPDAEWSATLTPLASERESNWFRLQITVWTAYPSCLSRTASASAIVVLPAPDGPSNSMIISRAPSDKSTAQPAGLYRLFRAVVIQMH